MINVGTVGDVGPGGDRFIQSLGLSVRGTGGGGCPFVALTLPLDDALPGLQGAFILGLRYYVD